MKYPQLKAGNVSRQFMTEFRGYHHTLKIDESEFYNMKNLTSDNYPVLSQRCKRGVVSTLASPQGLAGRDKLAYIDGTDLVYGESTLALGLTADDNPKQMVSMGAYLIVFPDKKYVNTQDLTDYGSLEKINTTTGTVTFSICKKDTTEYSGLTSSDTAPETPTNGMYWLDTSGEKDILKQYASTTGMWIQIATTYIKIASTGIGEGLKKGDGVKISGCVATGTDDFNNTFVIQSEHDDYIIIPGILSDTLTQDAAVTVARTVPTLDYVCESQNRVWGCHYGAIDGKPVNEIYACKLGDPFNWNCFAGVSTDSYAVTVGSDGPFTGAITHLTYPLFFKENCIHKIYGSYPSNYQVITTSCRGVQSGSYRSLAVVNEVLYYKSNVDICAYDGSLPQSVSEDLGGDRYSEAVGGCIGDKYYVSMKDTSDTYGLFVYDTIKGMWHKEDSTQVLLFARYKDDLYFINSADKLCTVKGTDGTLEDNVLWEAETGIIGFDYPDNKYISRFNIRANLSEGAYMDVFIKYNSSGDWEHQGNIVGQGLGSFTLPVIPRRCDHMRLKITGCGECKVYSIARLLETGGDV